jgi:hypothetical protein
VASSEGPLSCGYRDPQHRADAVLRSGRIAEEADYEVEIGGGTAAAHYVSDLQEFSGIVFPKKKEFSLANRTAVCCPNRWSSPSTWISLSAAEGSQRSKVTAKSSDRTVILKSVIVSSTATANHTTALAQQVRTGDNMRAYRQFGSGPGAPLLFLQHFLGTLDNRDPVVTDPLALGRSFILFERPLTTWQITP